MRCLVLPLGQEKSSPGCWRFCRALSRMVHIQCRLTPILHGSEGTSHSWALQICNLACPHLPSPVCLLTCEAASVLLSASISSSANSKAGKKTSDSPWPSGRWQPSDTGIAGRVMAWTLGYILGTVIFLYSSWYHRAGKKRMLPQKENDTLIKGWETLNAVNISLTLKQTSENRNEPPDQADRHGHAQTSRCQCTAYAALPVWNEWDLPATWWQ